MTRATRWDLIEQNDDQMIKFATAIRAAAARPSPPRPAFHAAGRPGMGDSSAHRSPVCVPANPQSPICYGFRLAPFPWRH